LEEHYASIFRVQSSACYLLYSGFLLGFFFDPEDGGDIFLQNVGGLSTGYTALCPGGQNSFGEDLIKVMYSSSASNFCLRGTCFESHIAKYTA
jgi:hypothetical protein